MIQDAAAWIWSLFGSSSNRQQYVQLPIDKFITWSSAGIPIMLLIFTQKYAAFIGKSDSLICAPPMSGGFALDGAKGVVGDGFTERFYMTTYCWEHMTHVPVIDVNDTANPLLQVRDVSNEDDVKDLTYLKVSYEPTLF